MIFEHKRNCFRLTKKKNAKHMYIYIFPPFMRSERKFQAISKKNESIHLYKKNNNKQNKIKYYIKINSNTTTNRSPIYNTQTVNINNLSNPINIHRIKSKHISIEFVQ